ncbi:glycosyltransferase involved in cell wall biosynthesis [Clostridium acetobutylicum]|uniref:Glycosyltransferase n=1 Tax=Clostridium acetobutylicum (strain ATCC 824 / DSM 792 / JCM 1419 / IAM 19013 / LMG 5710 / NBRC 13948 / NRRL B-527 / VKM B-1787 / 2291 / W) TaxID=272562 RepID=Q97H38_CLOAB|nr:MULTISPECIES: glycosyltransferase [Clostridium]AAK80133.1 Glycosyltransferase [Clostridium acetobutylicum ATCC 824]ADZ21226.1 Glycosyltransferase [Clostridium acetobutylicum EA 2018]AEI34720.1 glycosyltransferase [Clostridium acetobutylicum DSM 1731]AWV79442.1 glycosyltransferase [Clostridium acetobutylicum]MBC2394587.1 glycosyltransferase [Clostridium acetobutylicum]
MISVIMPVYNCEKYLEESIESILKQTYRDFEFIIVNDGSNDKSIDIINKYANDDNRIVVVSRDNNMGMVYSLNEGIDRAKGSYVARMDADDIALPERFERQIEYLNKNKDVDILACKVEAFGDVSREQKLEREHWYNVDLNNSESIESLFLENCYIAHPSVMMKMSVLKALGGYNLNYKRTEDYNLWLRAIAKGYKIAMLEEKLMKIRLHNDSKIHRDAEGFSSIRDIIQSRLEYVKEKLKLKDFSYVIWGASNGGKIAYEKIKEVFPNAKLNGYIDKFKTGKFEGVDIFYPEDLSKMKVDYVFIATLPGCKEAKGILTKNNFVPIKDFLVLC